jgi:hypothetical protein
VVQHQGERWEEEEGMETTLLKKKKKKKFNTELSGK